MDTLDTHAPHKPKSAVSSTVPIRVKRATSKRLTALVVQLNKKTQGRKVTMDDVVAKSISILTEIHFEEIKAETFSSEDRLEIEFKNFCKTNGALSKDEFLKRILSAGLAHLKSK